jgi:hypothetical protein
MGHYIPRNPDEVKKDNEERKKIDAYNKAQAQALANAKNEIENPKLPQNIESQKSTSVFDTSLGRQDAPQPHF